MSKLDLINDVESSKEINCLICTLCRDISHYNFRNISFELIEEIRTDSKYTGLYQLLELMFVYVLGFTLDNYVEVETPYKIIEMFSEACNVRDSIFEIKSSIDKLTSLHDKINIVLANNKIEPSASKVLKILHDIISHRRAMPVKYGIICNPSPADNSDQEIKANYVKFMAKKIKLHGENADITEIKNHVNSLFPEVNIHPFIQKCKTVMTFANEYEYLNIMIHKEKYNYPDYKFIHIPYKNYSNTYYKIINMTKFYFECNINKDYSTYIQYVGDLIHSKNITANTTVLWYYIRLSVIMGQMNDVCDLFLKYRSTILDIIKKSQKIPDKLTLEIVHCILVSIVDAKRSIDIKDIANIFTQYDIDDSEDDTILTIYDNISNEMRDISNTYAIIILNRYELINDFKGDKHCVICCSDIKNTDSHVVRCFKCKCELGHVFCMASWLENNVTCPLCKYVTNSIPFYYSVKI